MHCQPPNRARLARTRLEVMAISAVLGFIALSIFIASRLGEESFHISGAKADLRLIGVVPDGGDEIFDVIGRKIGSRFYDGDSPFAWGSNFLKRDFVFALGTNAGILPVTYSISANGRWSTAQGTIQRHQMGRRGEFTASAQFFEFYYRPNRLFTSRQYLEYVDVTVGFLRTNSSRPAAEFRGPFVAGVTNNDGRGTTLHFPGDRVFGNQLCAHFEFTTTLPQLNQNCLIFLNEDGGTIAFQITQSSSSSGPKGWAQSWSGYLPATLLSNVASVTLQQPEEITFHHVLVRHPDRPWRAYPEFNDQIVAKLADSSLKPEQVGTYQFTNRAQALLVLELARGAMIQNVWSAIRLPPGGGRTDIRQLPESDQARLRAAANRWIKTANPQIQMAGIEAGLSGAWPEFLEPALDFLVHAPDYQAYRIFADLPGLAPNLSEAQILQLTERALRPDSPNADSLLRAVTKCLEANASVTASNALSRLCLDGRPWIWWPVAAEARTRPLRPGGTDDLSLRLLLARRLDSTGTTAQKAALREQLPKWLGTDLKRQSPSAFIAMIHSQARLLPEQEALRLLARQLEEGRSDPVWVQRELLQEFNRLRRSEADTSSKLPPSKTAGAESQALRDGVEEALEWARRRLN